jgi:hypothetical protein
MNIRQAILQAADHIERNPQQFLYVSNEKPDGSCGTPGCMLGWVGVFLGVEADPREPAESWAAHVARAIGTTHNDFIWNFVSPESDARELYIHRGEPNAAANAAALLRIYADKHHPAEFRAPIPESVARIFRMSHAELVRELETA